MHGISFLLGSINFPRHWSGATKTPIDSMELATPLTGTYNAFETTFYFISPASNINYQKWPDSMLNLEEGFLPENSRMKLSEISINPMKFHWNTL